MTVQEFTSEGLRDLASTIKILADAEKMTAHKNAINIREQYRQYYEIKNH